MARTAFVLVFAAAIGSGIVAGIFYAFSSFVMAALGRLPPEQGAAAMNHINVTVITPSFMLMFMGTALLCLGVAVVAWRAGAGSLLAGAACYLLGPLGVTMAFNVPLNDRLAATAAQDAASAWPAYVTAWLRWNHVRTAIGTVGIAALGWGLAAA